MISEDDWSLVLVESLMKLLQQRYGLSSLYVKTEEDILYGDDCEFEVGFGMANLDQDKERYATLVEYQNYLMNGGMYQPI